MTTVYPRTGAADLPLPGYDAAAARAALAGADPRAMLMSLVHVTHDAGALGEFAAVCDPRADTGDLVEALTARLADVLTGGAATVDKPLPDELFHAMVSTFAREDVGPEFLPVLRDQCGFDALEAPARAAPPAPTGRHVVVIGAGLTGIAAAVRLAEAGHTYRVYERNADVGGVWLVNRYPGVGVDTPSHFYSYSFAVNPGWPAFYSSGPIVLDYLRKCADAYGVREHIEFDTQVVSCAWDEDARKWTVTTRHADGTAAVETADAVIGAIGFFQDPMYPDIPGLGDFAGTVVHTAAWDPELDLTGRRVALVGTGASAMQTAPTIVDDVAELTVFQRQPSWIQPRRAADLAVPEGTLWAMRHVPAYAEWFRAMTYWMASDGNFAHVAVDPAWTSPEVSVSAANERLRQVMIAYAREELGDRPDLLAKVVPAYPPFGKRILRDVDWYRMLRRDHVELCTDPIERIVPEGVRTADGNTVEADVLVLATGFHLLPMLRSVAVTGRDGVALAEVWGDEDPRAHLGVTVPGFPNFFVLSGPNSSPGHGAGNNFISEVQLHHVLACLDLVRERGARAIEPTAEAHEAYSRAVDAAMDNLVWSHPTVRGYYRNSSGRVVVTCPWRLVDYWHMLRTPDPEAHRLLT
ncbi:flavin-containing monooxygenase [Streptodolium elevatio]|uniref:NAD(P)/FAD-dependent oxidoreductase n=1 Tax=Streptodolium elevatio TaxID=3157996 RepID=A0ABV3D870_9ACTN